MRRCVGVEYLRGDNIFDKIMGMKIKIPPNQIDINYKEFNTNLIPRNSYHT